MAIKKEKFFEIINEVSKNEGLNENNLLERIGSELKDVNSGVYSTYNNLKIDKLFMIQDSDKTVNCMLLHLAVECNSVPIVKLLLEKKVKVDEQMSGDVNSKFTALHIAASHGHQEIVQLLLNNNANPSLKDSQGRTPRDIVGDVKDKKAIIKMLEAASSLTRDNENTKASVVERVRVLEGRQKENNNENNINKVDDTLERELAKRDAVAQKLQEAEQRFANNQKRIEQDYLHDQHLEQYTIHNGEQTFLNKSSSDDSGICFDGDGSEALGQSILENGEDIDAQDENGLTFLHRAAARNNKESVELLVKCGAKIDVQDKDGLTPLHYAAAYGCVEIAEYLVEGGANVNAQDKAEYTPLCYALANDKKESANLLMKYGADRSLIKDEGLIDRLNGMYGQLS
ncbi:ankyrin repeat domain-containing protein [Wolbachia endosymbiont (group A) of Anomoia purmunda]|uniref:ankyrin repeat domain-containing protein n=1 Tax=Wolbachia endosymbiont (group A) of Anomoia purmunda TaxID=2953978 RepID=UPI002230D9CB|nr:ankyrin repeat domain-containing protein [Wolbachia endosymbiont (group A) of Anomoia purmunda]